MGEPIGALNHIALKGYFMITYDFSPLYRSFVGFDRMANLIDAAAASANVPSNYPPYNIVKVSEDNYRIELALSGFNADQIDIETHENVLTISSQNGENSEASSDEFLHRGIAQRGFEKRFQLADHVRVTSADFNNGLLLIALERELPEALKPQKIAINGLNRRNSGAEKITEKARKIIKAA